MLYLLFPVLILCGNVKPQTTNGTEEELSRVARNQTSREFVTSPTEPGNRTSSVFRDEMRLLEEELENNQTSPSIPEDDEQFQDPGSKRFSTQCQEELLEQLSHVSCGEMFHTDMKSVSPENWCELEEIIRPYNAYTICLETVSEMVDCFYPNPIVQELFLSIHLHYFHNCSKEEEEELVFEDPPHELVLALTLVPVAIIPVLVYLVVCKSGVKE